MEAMVTTKLYSKTRQAVYVYRNIETRCYIHCCSGKAVCITYTECVFLESSIQHAMRLRKIVICGLSGSTIYLHIISLTARF